jgi:hypothetical protein
MTRDRDGTLHFTAPTGWPVPDVPTPPVVPQDPIGPLFRANRASGVSIDAQTSTPYWFGDRLDLGWAISVLHPAPSPPGGRPQNF